MEEQKYRQEHAELIARVIALETEYVIKREGYDEQASKPNEMERAEGFGLLNRVSKERLRKIGRNRYCEEEGEQKDERENLFSILYIYIMLLFDLEKHRDHKRNYELENEVCISEPLGEVIAVTDGVKEIFHIIIEIYRGKNYEGEWNIRGYIAEEAVVIEYRHRERRITGVVSPAKNALQDVGGFIADTLEPSTIDNVDEGVGEEEAYESDRAEGERKNLQKEIEAVSAFSFEEEKHEKARYCRRGKNNRLIHKYSGQNL